MRRSAGLAITAAVSALVLAGVNPARATVNLVANGSFENPSVGGGYNIYPNGAVPGWISNNNELEIDATSILSPTPAFDGAQSAEVNGNTFDTISQAVAGFTVGAQYNLFWAYGSRPGSGPQQLDVVFGGAAVRSDTDSGSAGAVAWTPNSFTVTATATTEMLSFAAVNVGGAPSVGNELDAVSLTAVPAPEPISLALLGSGVLGLGLVRRKRG